MKFIDLLIEYRIPYKTEGHHHCRPGWIQIDCPFCGDGSHKFHMGYSLVGNYINCWQCGSHPTVNVLIELTGLSTEKCRRLLKGLEKSKFEKRIIRGRLKIPKGVGDLQIPHARYLVRRGFLPGDIIQLWKVQGIGIASKLSWRIFIPIIYRGETVSWTTRAISDKANIIRYISAKSEQETIPHKELLYGEDYARHAIIIVEGPFDVWKIGPGAVATLGLGYSQAQVNKMIRYPIRAICFDSDRQAQKRANKLFNTLSVFKGDTYNVILDSKDAAEASIEELKTLRERFLY